MREELAEDVVAAQHVYLVGEEEFFGRRVEDRFASSDAGVVHLREKGSDIDRMSECPTANGDRDAR